MTPTVIFLSILLAIAVVVLLATQSKSFAKGRRLIELTAENARLSALQTSAEAARADLEAANARLQQRIDELSHLNGEAVSETARLNERIDALDRENRRIVDQHKQIEQQLEERFKDLAAKILMANSETLREQNRNGLAEVLAPMKKDIEQFRDAFTQRYDKESAERFSLAERVRELAQLNHTITLETRKLNDALRGNAQAQGNWGEMILDNILESSGLRAGHEYTLQQTFIDEDGANKRPDVVINYSDGRKLIIDSKVSIQDYLQMLNADNDDQRRNFAQQHIASVKNHINKLSQKKYQTLIEQQDIDFVLMFIPHEGAYMATMKLDQALWQTAFDKHIIIISPTHLMSVISLVEQVWRHDRQNQNAIDIARKAGLMLDKLNGLLTDITLIESNIERTAKSCRDAIAKLSTGRGNVISKVAELQAMGAKAQKAMPARFISETSEDFDNPEQ